MDFIESVREQLKTKSAKKIILPESNDERILRAAAKISEEKIVNIILLGSKPKIKEKAQELKINLDSVEIIDPEFDVFKEEYVNQYYQLRKHKGISHEEAKKALEDPSVFATMTVHVGRVDGMVAGATWPTANTLRPALQIIKTKKELPIASSFFIMGIEGKIFFFADCAFVKNPDFEELAYIALETANSAKKFSVEPRIALLSFSTRGSGGEDESIKKIHKATKLVRNKKPELLIEGEIQLDTAIIPEVSKLKCPDCVVKGDANILIFPDLNSGNIGYKLVQRFAKAKAIGPIVQGLKKPVNDLSRGCNVEDIVNVVLITALEADEK